MQSEETNEIFFFAFSWVGKKTRPNNSHKNGWIFILRNFPVRFCLCKSIFVVAPERVCEIVKENLFETSFIVALQLFSIALSSSNYWRIISNCYSHRYSLPYCFANMLRLLVLWFLSLYFLLMVLDCDRCFLVPNIWFRFTCQTECFSTSVFLTQAVR